MAFTVDWYGPGLLAIFNGDVDLPALTVKLSLHTSSYAPNRDTHDFRNDLTNELSGSGYAIQTLANDAYSLDVASQQVRYDFDDPVFSFSGSSTWRYGVIQVVRGGATSADELIALLDWGADQTSSVEHTLVIPTGGLLFTDYT